MVAVILTEIEVIGLGHNYEGPSFGACDPYCTTRQAASFQGLLGFPWVT